MFIRLATGLLSGRSILSESTRDWSWTELVMEFRIWCWSPIWDPRYCCSRIDWTAESNVQALAAGWSLASQSDLCKLERQLFEWLALEPVEMRTKLCLELLLNEKGINVWDWARDSTRTKCRNFNVAKKFHPHPDRVGNEVMIHDLCVCLFCTECFTKNFWQAGPIWTNYYWRVVGVGSTTANYIIMNKN